MSGSAPAWPGLDTWHLCKHTQNKREHIRTNKQNHITKKTKQNGNKYNKRNCSKREM